MSEPRTFYYHFNPLNFWLLLNIALLYMILCCAVKFPHCYHWIQFYILVGLLIASWGLWIYKHILKQRLALITDKEITIDHCQPLLWENVTGAEERIVRCCLRKLKIVVLNTKPEMEYHYNFLQKHNGPFTPFSLPLYSVIKKQDAEELKRILLQKVRYTSLPESNS